MDSSTDKLLVGGRTSADITGTYTVASEIAAMPTTELLAPLGRVLFPAFVNKRDDPEAFARSVSTAIGVQALVAIPACVGLALVAGDAVLLLLGAKWTQTVPLIQIMAVTNLLFALVHSGGYALLATGKIKMLTIVTWLQALLFLGTAVIVFPQAGANELAEIRLAVVAVGSLVLIGMVLSQIKALSAGDIFWSLFRPLLASSLMGFALVALHPLLGNLATMSRLLLEISAGGAVYGVSITLMWLGSGRPEGAESYLLKNVIRKHH